MQMMVSFSQKRRWACLAVLLGGLLALMGGCRALQLDRDAFVSASGTIVGGDLLFRRNAVAGTVVPPLEEAWSFNAGAGFGPGSPLIVGRTVLIATRKGEIHSIDLSSGKKTGVEDFGEALEGTPAVQASRIYVPIAAGRRALQAYDLTRGATVWSAKGPPIEAGVLPVGNGVIVVDAAATVRKYASDDGEVLWETQLSAQRHIYTTPVTAGGTVALADDFGGLVALDPEDGSVRWTMEVGAPVYVSMTSDQRTLFVPTTRGKLVAVDAADGQVRWRFAVPDTSVRLTTPAVDGGLVLVGGSDGMLRAVEAETGVLRWSVDAGAAITAAPLLTPDVVYVGTMGRLLLAYDRATGARLWEVRLKGRIKSALAAREGFLVVLTEPRFVYLFRSTSAAAHAASP